MGEAFTTEDSDFERPANVSIPSRQRPVEDIMDDIRGAKNLSEAVHVSLGAASVCWEDMSNTGIFQSERALAIGEALTEYIGEHFKLRADG